MCILLLLGGVFYKCQLGPVIWWRRKVNDTCPHLCLLCCFFLPDFPRFLFYYFPSVYRILFTVILGCVSATNLLLFLHLRQSLSSLHSWRIFSFLSCFFFCLSRAAPGAYGGSQVKNWIRATAADLCHSHSNLGSEPTPATSHSSQQC